MMVDVHDHIDVLLVWSELLIKDDELPDEAELVDEETTRRMTSIN